MNGQLRMWNQASFLALHLTLERSPEGSAVFCQYEPSSSVPFFMGDRHLINGLDCIITSAVVEFCVHGRVCH